MYLHSVQQLPTDRILNYYGIINDFGTIEVQIQSELSLHQEPSQPSILDYFTLVALFHSVCVNIYEANFRYIHTDDIDISLSLSLSPDSLNYYGLCTLCTQGKKIFSAKRWETKQIATKEQVVDWLRRFASNQPNDVPILFTWLVTHTHLTLCAKSRSIIIHII